MNQNKVWYEYCSQCKCHGAWGCRLYKNQTWNEFPLTEKEIEE